MLLYNLDCLTITKLNPEMVDEKLYIKLRSTKNKMLSWSRNMLFNSGKYPNINDSFNNADFSYKILEKKEFGDIKPTI